MEASVDALTQQILGLTTEGNE